MPWSYRHRRADQDTKKRAKTAHLANDKAAAHKALLDLRLLKERLAQLQGGASAEAAPAPPPKAAPATAGAKRGAAAPPAPAPASKSPAPAKPKAGAPAAGANVAAATTLGRPKVVVEGEEEPPTASSPAASPALVRARPGRPAFGASADTALLTACYPPMPRWPPTGARADGGVRAPGGAAQGPDRGVQCRQAADLRGRRQGNRRAVPEGAKDVHTGPGAAAAPPPAGPAGAAVQLRGEDVHAHRVVHGHPGRPAGAVGGARVQAAAAERVQDARHVRHARGAVPERPGAHRADVHRQAVTRSRCALVPRPGAGPMAI